MEPQARDAAPGTERRIAPVELGELVRDTAGADAVALIDGERRLDRSALSHEVGVLARTLAARGVGPGTTVALAAERRAETIVAILALLKLRAAYLPLDLGYPPERLAQMLEDARPALAIGTRDALARMPAFEVPHCAFALGGTLECEGSIGPRADAGRFGSGAAPSGLPPLPQERPGEDAIAYVLFTSGSTGRPKGVAMRRAPLAHLVGWHLAHERLARPARTLQFAPLSFDVHFQEIATTLASGGTLVLVDEATRRNPAALLERISAERIERIYLPYVALHALAEAAASRPELPLSLRDVVSAGEALRVTPAIRALFRRLGDAALHNHYGPTETHVVTAATLAGDPDRWPELPSIGTPLPHVAIAIDADGTLRLGGDCLAAGYVARPELTAQRFVERDGARWYATGDRVELNPDGTLAYLGRDDAQLKIGGFRIEPAEVELALLAEPSVREAAVGARTLDDGAPALVAWIVPRERPAPIEVLLAALRRRLPHYLVPARIVAVESLPTTASGKIDLAALPMPPNAPAFEAGARPEDVVGTLWREELGVETLDPELSVFDAGASSLAVARFVAAAARRSSLRIEIADVYAAPSVRALAARLGGAKPPAGAARGASRGAAQREALAQWRRDGARA